MHPYKLLLDSDTGLYVAVPIVAGHTQPQLGEKAQEWGKAPETLVAHLRRLLLGLDQRGVGVERELGLLASSDDHPAEMSVDLPHPADAIRHLEPGADGVGTRYPAEATEIAQSPVPFDLSDVLHSPATAAEHQGQRHDVLLGPDATVGTRCRQLLADAVHHTRDQCRLLEHRQTTLAGDCLGRHAKLETELFLTDTTTVHEAASSVTQQVKMFISVRRRKDKERSLFFAVLSRD